jgi:fumarate hydratase subunit alpha
MRIIDTDTIKKTLKDIILKACVSISPDCETALKNALKSETVPEAKFALEMLCQNIFAARENNIPACQDTGMAVIFMEIGQDVKIEGDYIYDALNEAVKEAYSEGCFRMSVLDPVTRMNTGTNTPAIIHTEIVKGDKLTLSFIAKGFGSENMSRLYMLKPSEGIEGVKRCVIQTVREAGSNPCPPIIVGVGIGGTADKAMDMAKHSLLRDIGSVNPDAYLAELEKEILKGINALNIGAQGFKGANTALAVFIEKFPTHLAALPVAVNVQCHSVRKGGAVI